MYFSKCCGCIPLKRGLIILGILNMLSSLSSINDGLNFKKNFEDLKEKTNSDQGLIKHRVSDQDSLDEYVKAAGYIVVMLGLIQLIFSIVLIVAVSKENKNALKSYYVYSIARLIVGAIAGVCFIIYCPKEILTEMLILFFIIGFVFEVYLILLVRSMLHEIQQKPTLPLTNNQVVYSPTVAPLNKA